MAEIVRITPSTIELREINFKDDGEKVQKIMDIAHRFKHLYLEGYPCGRKTRKESKKRYKKWSDCPEICFTYLVTNDNTATPNNLIIRVLVSDVEHLIEKYTQEEIDFYTQMYTQDVADEIVRTI